ncbi:MAG: hypothetical protein COU11_01850 [Candidatus Harrisonbacteria bacterium CG10_big_fil_rev_8_21_14_0_10_49_15]|uniref:Uncharacterized protein n=1 Tax=Candidatus Harrisonbacteria bacterium CG10_big_fil_rev_8_21_14_0_10_49_15 TaxID=1974587 RepID=A0A2H0ULB6_9BACT|nr:MAG: hypothetical protein COU11_01850 [Candidatus Harrisonbacteria bacterium CG10_big_fil_rev_8_21_14_0_10_49_15]
MKLVSINRLALVGTLLGATILSVVLFMQPVSVAAQEACPDKSTITPGYSMFSDSREAYRDGYAKGCEQGIDQSSSKNLFCEIRSVPSEYLDNSSHWEAGCRRGHDEGSEIYERNNQPSEADLAVIAQCQAYKESATADKARTSDPYSEEDANNYYRSCLAGYKALVENNQPSSFCSSQGSEPKKIGCMAGFLFAEEKLKETPLEPASAEVVERAREINYCGIASILDPTANPNTRKGTYEGCVDGYEQAEAGGENICPPAPDGSLSEPDPRIRSYNVAYADACRAGRQYFLNPPDPDDDPDLTSLDTTTKGIVPKCDPSLTPDAVAPFPRGVGPCDFNQFVVLIKNIMRYLILLVIPIAAAMIGWGGFLIMTAAGSPERVKKGTNAIVIALTGILIIAASYLVVQVVIKLLVPTGSEIIERIGV